MARHFVLRAVLAGLALAAIMGSAVPGQARVDVTIGINLPAPPQLVPVPSTSIAYAPSVNANYYFFFSGEYYVFTNGVWYVSRGYNGPWVALAPAFVPQPLLAVPVRYYRRPPTAWRQWRREGPPRWEAKWGRRWQERRHEGQALPRERREGTSGRWSRQRSRERS